MHESSLGELQFKTVSAGSHRLGWRFTPDLPTKAAKAITDFIPHDQFFQRFSVDRTVDLPAFAIATTPIAVAELLADPYKVETVHHAFKLGDGGEAICGAYPWPITWLSLSPSWSLGNHDVQDCFLEFIEGAFVRPVRDS